MNGDEMSSELDDDHGSIPPNSALGADGGNGPGADPPDEAGNAATLASSSPVPSLDDDAAAVIHRGMHAFPTTADASRTDTTTAFGA